MQSTEWLNRELYPFHTRTVPIDGYRMNAIDEGSGPVLLLVHGTPGWSFEFRRVIALLSNRYRCIAPDHLGFGLSDRGSTIDYTVQGHARRLKKFIDALQLNDIHLFVHDFGGPIGLSVAIDEPTRFRRITISNSWLWSLNDDPHFMRASKLIHSRIGRFLYERINISAKVLLKQGFADQRLLSPEIHRHYIKAQDRDARKGAYQFALSLFDEADWYDSLWRRRDRLSALPLTVLWGMKDPLLPHDRLLERWKRGFPDARIVVTANGSGHFPHEEEPDLVVRTLLD